MAAGGYGVQMILTRIILPTYASITAEVHGRSPSRHPAFST